MNENQCKIIFNHSNHFTMMDARNKQTEKVNFGGDENIVINIVSVIKHPTKQHSIIIGTNKGNLDTLTYQMNAGNISCKF